MDAGGKERFHLWLQCFECKSTEQKEAGRVESELKSVCPEIGFNAW